MPDSQPVRFKELLEEFNKNNSESIKVRELVETPRIWSVYRNPKYILCKCCGSAHFMKDSYRDNSVLDPGPIKHPVEWDAKNLIVYAGVEKEYPTPQSEIGKEIIRLEAEDFDFIICWSLR